MSVNCKFRPKGKFKIEQFRAGQKIGEFEFDNGVVDEGANLVLDVMFHGVAAVGTWYLGLIDNAGFSALDPEDSAAEIGGTNAWDECSDYDEANRVTWAEGAAGSRAITNGTTADFTINATKTIKGIFVVSTNTKGGTTGTLWATAAFGSNISVIDNDVLKVTYTVSC